MGRPVVFNRAAEIKLSQIKNIEQYCDYYIYFIQIYMRTKMRGYVDQMVVVGDLKGLGTDNFKLEVTKRNVSDSLSYGAERQYTLITVNTNKFAQLAWNGFIKSLLPKKTLHKINIVGVDKAKILKTLESHMDAKYIP